MTFVLTASNAHHAHLVTPLSRLLRRRGHTVRLVYGGRFRPSWRPPGAWHIAWYARQPRWPRWLLLRHCVQQAVKGADAVIVTSARYHLEQTTLRVCKARRIPCLFYPSTLMMEAAFAWDSQRKDGPRVHLYDHGDIILTQGQHLKDQLIAHGITRPIHVIGSPQLEDLCS